MRWECCFADVDAVVETSRLPGYPFADGQKTIRLERVVPADGKEIRVYGN